MSIERMMQLGIATFFSAACVLVSADAAAQSYPNKPISFIVPFGPGTGNDIIARIIAQKVGESWTQPMVVENRAGASGAVALELTAKAAPNGYTIVIASTSQILTQFVSKVRYDLGKDFAPVSIAGSLPYVLAVSSSSSAKSINELVALAKAKPGKVTYSAGMIGGVPHFLGVMLMAARGIDLAMVPYKSTTDAQADVISGRVEVWFTTMATALPQVKAGKVRALGISGDKRAAALPDVPTMAEAGVPTLDVSVSFYILAPAATPKPILGALNGEIVNAINSKEVRERLAAAGVEPKSSTPEELDAVLKSELTRWSKIIKDSGIRVDS